MISSTMRSLVLASGWWYVTAAVARMSAISSLAYLRRNVPWISERSLAQWSRQAV